MNDRPDQMIQTMAVLLLIMVSAFSSVCAEENQDQRELARQVVLQGILGSKVLLLVDGQRQMMSTKDAAQLGVRVLRIMEEKAEVLIDGKRRVLKLGDSFSTAGKFKMRESTEVIISKNTNGMYTTVGSINGLPVSFLVDTGASTIAMNAQHARRLGLDFLVSGEPTFVGTASGVTKAFRVTLDKVTVGGIAQHNISAVVIDGGFPVQTLLGMSFLGRLEIQRDGNVMRLKKNF